MSQIQVRLSRYDAQPWGFRLQGGTDFGTPLIVQKVNAGSLSEQAGLLPGDQVLSINDVDVYALRHKEAQDLVVRSGNTFTLNVLRGQSTWRPHVTPTGNVPNAQGGHLGNNIPTVTKTSLAHRRPQEEEHIGCGYNNSARPFNAVNGNGPVKSIVNKQYNSPVGIYSDEAIAETLSAQAEVLAEGVLGVNFKKNEKQYNAEKSEVLKFLREAETEPAESEPPSPFNFYWQQSHAIGGNARSRSRSKSPGPRATPRPVDTPRSTPKQVEVDRTIGTPLQDNTLAPDAAHRPSLPVQRRDEIRPAYPPQPLESPDISEQIDPVVILEPICPLLQGPNYQPPAQEETGVGGGDTADQPASNLLVCMMCGASIAGVFVRIKDKNLHAECFRCATCGTSLKNQGYYNFNNKLYCDIHAKLAATQNPPSGTDGGTKLSANNISAALSAHGYQGIPAAANVPVTYSQQHHQKYQQPQQQQHQPQQQQQQHYAPQPKVNQPFTRPYGSGPVSPHVPTASPKSPQIYPPSTQPDSWNQPRPTPQAQQSPYATLPRTNYGGAAQPQYQRQQEQECTEIYEQKQTTTEQTTLTQQQQTHYFQEEIELTDSRQTKQQNFVWPPPGSEEGTYEVPTAAPLYIPPPETQRVKTVEKVRFEEPEPEPQPQPIVEQPPQWQSRSAPELGSNPPEIASGADSYASTCTSTTTTSDEYQRIYASEQYQRQAYEAHSSYDAMSGRRSAQECVDTLNTPISNYKLVDMVREVTPTPTPKPQKRVEFSEEKKVITIDSQSLSDATEEARFQQIETQRMFQPTPEIKFVIPENRYLPPSNIHNTIPKEYVSPMIQALTTAPDSPVQFIECSCPYSHVEFHPPPPIVSPQQNICQAACQQQEAICQQQSVCQRQSICQEESVCQKTICQEQQQQQEQSTPAILNEEPPKASFISGLMTTAPQEPVHFAPNPDEVIPLPQEQEAYMPPPIDMKPYMREDFRPKSPFLSALIVAPEQPLQPFQREVPSQLLDLPTPTCKLTMADALRIAPERCYSPLSQENSSNFVLDEIPSKPDLEKSAFTNMQEKPFQPAAGPLTQTRQSITSLTSAQKEQIEATRKSVTSIQSNTSVKSNTSIQKTQDHENRRESEHLNMNIQSAPVEERISYPPPSPLHSPHVTHAKHYDAYGLHKPETIPQYQRNWTVLPSQRPVRTPEPPELRENVPLAFIDASPSPTPRPTTETPQFETEQHIEQQRQLISSTNAKSVPIIVEDRSGPVTMTFQSLDSHLQQEDHSRIRSLTPCSQINKPAPIIPFYQAPEKLLFEECDPTKSQLFDRRSVSPYSNRAKSPAPGPPPNPLNSIRAPRLKSPVREGFGGFVANIPRPQAGSIMTGQSAQGQLISNYQASNISGSQSFVNKPEIIQQGTIGDMSYERRENESRMAEEKRAQMESKTTTQVGNAQIQRHRKVIEEYEHTQNQKSIEIRTEFGKPGFVASEARRLSGLDQELTNLSSQSRAISAKAADLTKFPQHQFQTDAKFPTKSLLPSYDEPKQPAYVVPTATPNKVAGQQPGYLAQSQNPYAPSSGYSASSIQQQQKQCSSLMSSSSLNATNSLTNSSAFANTNVSAPSIKPPFGGSIGGGQPIYKPPDSQQLQQRQSSISSTNQNINISSDINSGGAGSNKGGAISARSAPKRGYGILNKAGSMRTPQCSSCGTMIRGPFITALGRIWCPEHFICVRQNCHRPLQDIGFVEEKGDLYCEYCFEQYLAPTCSKCNGKIKGDCLNAIGKHFHPECFNCFYCGKLFGNTPFFLEEGNPYCEADWNELFTTKCFACGFPVEAGDRWVEALNHNYHSQCFNCTMCKKNLEGQSFYNKGGRPFCKNHAR